MPRALVREASRHGLTAARREAERTRHLEATPWWYRPWLHLVGTVSVGLITLVLAIAAWRMHALGPIRASDVAIVPIVFVLANYAEWRIHKYVLHRRLRLFPFAYDIHTAMHHMIYVEDDMALRSAREARLVLMPVSGVAALVIGTAPLAYVVGRVWSMQAGSLFLVSASLSLVAYELMHFAYHLPASTFLGRLRIIGVLRAHHARHHDPRLMQRHNFNVTLPLFDWLMGTMAPPREHDEHPSNAGSGCS